jgi:hypothetical protein
MHGLNDQWPFGLLSFINEYPWYILIVMVVAFSLMSGYLLSHQRKPTRRRFRVVRRPRKPVNEYQVDYRNEDIQQTIGRLFIAYLIHLCQIE